MLGVINFLVSLGCEMGLVCKLHLEEMDFTDFGRTGVVIS